MATVWKCQINLRKPVEQLIKELLEADTRGRVFHQTEYTSREWFIPKKNGTARLVVDYRTTNKHIYKPVWPMIFIDKVKGKMKPEWRYFLSMAII